MLHLHVCVFLGKASSETHKEAVKRVTFNVDLSSACQNNEDAYDFNTDFV